MRMELEILYEMREREEEDGESCSVDTRAFEELKYELQDNVGLSKNTMEVCARLSEPSQRRLRAEILKDNSTQTIPYQTKPLNKINLR